MTTSPARRSTRRLMTAAAGVICAAAVVTSAMVPAAADPPRDAPVVFTTEAQVARAAERVAAHEEPFYGSWLKTKAAADAALTKTYVPEQSYHHEQYFRVAGSARTRASRRWRRSSISTNTSSVTVSAVRPDRRGRYRTRHRTEESSMITFADQSAVVVGAGAGIGRAAATLLAELGAAVACVDRDEAAATKTADAITDAGGRAVAAAADVTDPDAVRAAFDTAEQAFGQLHAVANCAGVTGKTGVPSHEADLADFDAVYRINVLGALHVSRAALEHMLPHGYGRIVHVASISGKEGNPNMVAYSTSKAALIGMVKAQGKEYAQAGVTVNAIAPAVVRTDMVAALPDDVVSYMVAKIPMGRTGELSEAAALIAFVASSVCSFTTGFTFDLTGGRATY